MRGGQGGGPGRRSCRCECQRPRPDQRKMKSIGEISIAPLPGGISGILDAQGAGKRQPQEPQHSGPKGRRDRLPPRAAHRLEGQRREKLKRQKRPFSTKLRKTLRRYVGARVSSAWLRSPFRLAPAAGAPSDGAAAEKRSTIPQKNTMVAVSALSPESRTGEGAGLPSNRAAPGRYGRRAVMACDISLDRGGRENARPMATHETVKSRGAEDGGLLGSGQAIVTGIGEDGRRAASCHRHRARPTRRLVSPSLA